jgi:hypothetical protein
MLFYKCKDSLALIEWVSCNQMKANPDKFQAIAIDKKSMDKNIVLDLAGNKIKDLELTLVVRLCRCLASYLVWYQL